MLPIATDAPVRRTPWVNYGLIAANVLVFLVSGRLLEGWVGGVSLRNSLMLWADSPRWYQFFTSMFLHGGWLHLLGNMVFLWVFGNSLNNKLGSAVYLLFYLASGLFAGAGYVLFHSRPVVGASGAIFGVATGFLVLFPLTRVRTIYWLFYFIGVWDLNGLTIVGYFVAYNLVCVLLGVETGVAYLAHLSGAFFGFWAAMLLLVSGSVGRDRYDLLAVWRRHRQRVRAAEPADQPTFGPGPRPGEPAEAFPVGPAPDTLTEARSRIAQALAAGDAVTAGRFYGLLRSADPSAALPVRQQLDLANHLMSDGQHALAADAYEVLLVRYPTFESAEQIELLLGLLHGRYLGNPVRARHYLERCLGRLRDPNQQVLCREELAHVRAVLDGQ